MNILPQLTATGIVNGVGYALVAFGLIAIYRVTRVVNFAQGEFVMVGAFMAATLETLAWPWPLRLLGATAATVLVGLLVHRLALQPAGKQAPADTLLIITLGVSLLLRGIAQVVWGSDPTPVEPFTPGPALVLGTVALPTQALWVVAGGVVAGVSLFVFFQRTTLGLALRASAESPLGAHLAGVDTWRMGRLSFAIGCGLAGFAGVLLSPLSFVSYDVGLFLGFKGFTAAILGGLHSLPGAAAGGLLLGLLESYSAGFVSSAYRDVTTFAVLVLVLLVRPAGLTRRAPAGAADASKPLVGSLDLGSHGIGLHRWSTLGMVVALAALSVVFPDYLRAELVFAGLFGIAAVGVILLLGYAGQVSLGQASLLGIGGYASAILPLKLGVPPLLALLCGMVVASLVAWAIATIIFRLEGFYLAMATLGLSVIFTVVATQARDLTGGANGIPGVRPFEVAGLTLRGDEAYLLLVWALLAVVMLLGFNLVDSRFGRAMRALKGDPVAALAAGVDVPRAKLDIFVLSAALAAIVGSLYVHYITLAYPVSFDVLQALKVLVMAIVGGITSLWGAPVGAIFMTLVPDVIQRSLPGGELNSRAGQIEQILFGVLLIVVMVWRPDGLTGVLGDLVQHAQRRLATRRAATAALAPMLPSNMSAVSLRPPATANGHLHQPDHVHPGSAAPPLLQVERLSKTFGGLRAVQQVSLSVRAQSIVALIGPNGAGKTTLFNCIAGTLRPDDGVVRFGGRQLAGVAPHRVVGFGLSRTFQNVRLYHNMTALENVMVGCHHRGTASLADGALRTARHGRDERRIRDEARYWLAAVGLDGFGDRPAGSLPFGFQRLLEIARALAARPRMLLLDEPAAGLNATEKGTLAGLLRRLRGEGFAILLVEHDVQLVMDVAEHIFVLDHGVLIAEGAPAAVRRDPAVLEAYLGTSA